MGMQMNPCCCHRDGRRGLLLRASHQPNQQQQVLSDGWGYRVGVLGVVDYPRRGGRKGRQMGPIDWELWAASPETWAPSVTPKDEELFGQVVRRQMSMSFSICDMEVASPLSPMEWV